MQILSFSHLFLKLFANIKDIFRMLKIYIKNIYNYLIISEKDLL